MHAVPTASKLPEWSYRFAAFDSGLDAGLKRLALVGATAARRCRRAKGPCRIRRPAGTGGAGRRDRPGPDGAARGWRARPGWLQKQAPVGALRDGVGHVLGEHRPEVRVVRRCASCSGIRWPRQSVRRVLTTRSAIASARAPAPA